MGLIVDIKTSLNFPSVFKSKRHCNVRGQSCELLSCNSPLFRNSLICDRCQIAPYSDGPTSTLYTEHTTSSLKGTVLYDDKYEQHLKQRTSQCAMRTNNEFGLHAYRRSEASS